MEAPWHSSGVTQEKEKPSEVRGITWISLGYLYFLVGFKGGESWAISASLLMHLPSVARLYSDFSKGLLLVTAGLKKVNN